MKYKCGSCSMCCYLLAIPDLAKPARQWCDDACRPHGGCKVHHLKEELENLHACRDFACMWLLSQEQEASKRMSWSMRPNNSQVMFCPPLNEEDGKRIMYVHVDPSHPTAWREGEANTYIQNVLGQGVRVEIIVGENEIKIEPEEKLPLETDFGQHQIPS